MWQDYGYIEEEKRVKPYDFKLMLRLTGYVRPYISLLVLTSLLIVAATAAELVLPYLTKVAVDRYIVVSHQIVRTESPDKATRELFARSHGLFIPSGRDGVFFLSAENARKLDPLDAARLKKSGLLQPKQYYLVPNKPGTAMDVVRENPGLFQVFPAGALIASTDLSRLDESQLARLRAGDVAGLAWIAVICCAVLVLGYFFNFAQVVLLETTGQRMSHDIRQDLLKHVLTRSISFHDRSPTGVLVARVTNDIQNLNEMIKSVAVTLFKDFFILAGIMAILIQINMRLALLTFALLPPILLVTGIFRRLARDVFRELRGKVAQINTAFSENMAGIRIVQVFRREEYNSREFARLNHDNYLAGMRQIKIFAVFMPLIELISALAMGVIIWYGGLSVLSEAMTLGAVVAFIAYAQKFFQPIRDLAEKYNILQSAMASLERIFGLLDDRSALPPPSVPTPLPESKGEITFDRVSFAYRPGEPVLREVSFRVPAGRTLAIVGATGAGKTSIINLLLRFYDVSAGRVLVDGRDVRELDPAGHRSRIGLVMQDVFLFSGTIRENISLAGKDLPMDRIRSAAEAVNAAGFIESLPLGYDQPIGEGGLSLSVGQRQLLSFARVLARDPRILVLDEATASIDSETEKLIETALARLTAGRTSIIIAHRLSTIQRADQILVLNKGRVAEIGTHQELLSLHGLYHHLHLLQYRENRLANHTR